MHPAQHRYLAAHAQAVDSDRALREEHATRNGELLAHRTQLRAMDFTAARASVEERRRMLAALPDEPPDHLTARSP